MVKEQTSFTEDVDDDSNQRRKEVQGEKRRTLFTLKTETESLKR